MGRNTVHLTVTVTPELGQFVRARVASGAFASQSEVVRAGLRALRRAEPDDPWAESSAASPTASQSGPDPEPSRAGEDEARAIAEDRARLKEALPTLYRHGRAILRLCEEYGAENFQVPRRVLEDGIAEDERNLVRLVVDSDPERIYPVTAELGSRIEELLGIHVWMDELPWFRSSSSPSAKKYVPLEPLLFDPESGSSPQSEKGR